MYKCNSVRHNQPATTSATTIGPVPSSIGQIRHVPLPRGRSWAPVPCDLGRSLPRTRTGCCTAVRSRSPRPLRRTGRWRSALHRQQWYAYVHNGYHSHHNKPVHTKRRTPASLSTTLVLFPQFYTRCCTEGHLRTKDGLPRSQSPNNGAHKQTGRFLALKHGTGRTASACAGVCARALPWKS